MVFSHGRHVEWLFDGVLILLKPLFLAIVNNLKRLISIEITFRSCIILKSKPITKGTFSELKITVLRRFSLGLNLQLRYVVSSCSRLIDKIRRLAIKQVGNWILHGVPLHQVPILHEQDVL